MNFLAFLFLLILSWFSFRQIKVALWKRSFRPDSILFRLFLGGTEFLLLAAVLVALPFCLLHPISVIAGYTTIALFCVIAWWRRQSSIRALEDAIEAGVEMGKGSAGFETLEILKTYAELGDEGLGRRCRTFFLALARGIERRDALAQARIPISPTHQRLLLHTTSQPAEQDQAEQHSTAVNDRYKFLADFLTQSTTNVYPVRARLTYLVLLVLASYVISLSYSMVLPSLREMVSDISTRGQAAMNPNGINLGWYFSGLLPSVIVAATIMVGFILLWLLLVLLVWFFPASRLTTRVPWYSKQIRDEHRFHSLRSMATGLEHGVSIVDWMTQASRSDASGWVRSKASKMLKMTSTGAGELKSLQKSGWILRPELAYLKTAEQNGRLAEALEITGDDIERRQHAVWQLRLSWLTPLVTIVVACYVCVFSYGSILLLVAAIQSSHFNF